MSELRAGGLAMIIGGNPETIGLVVITERMVEPGGVVVTPSGKRFANGGSLRWLIHNDRLFVKVSDGSIINDYCLVFPHWLMPIDGEDFSHEDERQKELTNG
ncbi:hypothetical protein SJ598_13685 [Enterobacter bugandensis]|uniref:hypothetical protein n=1 Tax=Enterobacter bugandensis TaxID=881260 RepID=UPI0029DD6BF6|nr:hypothetical protein [Enterobacter bugandensis]MDX7621236.1 hypothetical protein [Enterobacter bugandensis]